MQFGLYRSAEASLRLLPGGRDSAGRTTGLRRPVRDPIRGLRHLDFTSAIPRAARCSCRDPSAVSRSPRRGRFLATLSVDRSGLVKSGFLEAWEPKTPRIGDSCANGYADFRPKNSFGAFRKTRRTIRPVSRTHGWRRRERRQSQPERPRAAGVWPAAPRKKLTAALVAKPRGRGFARKCNR
jgi:hypothetical protein